jgi:hypothetical protein
MAGAKQSSKRPVKKTATKQSAASGRIKSVDSPRRLQSPKYRAFRYHKRIKHPVKLPGSWKIAKMTRRFLYKNWKVIGGIILVYGVLNILLVRGFSGGLDVSQLKSQFDTLLHGVFGHLAAGLTVLTLLVGTSTTTSGASGATTYQSVLILMVSLALIWAFRQLMAGNKIRIRDAYYGGMYPIVPVILVLVVTSLQLIPMLIGGWLFTTVVQNGIAITGIEKLLWGIVFFLLSLLSVYMLTSSLFALYIATLEHMTPMKALRSARQLVRFRRWVVMRKILFLPLWLMVVGVIIMLPIILIVPIAAQWAFTILTMIGLAFGNAYMYTLYRELLREKN